MQPAKPMETLREWYLTGHETELDTFLGRMRGDAAFARLADQLVWTSEGQTIQPFGSTFLDAWGHERRPGARLALAHPVEMSAEEISAWRAVLIRRGVEQPFRQVWEPVVLRGGRLTGAWEQVDYEGVTYPMLMRYRGFRLPLQGLTALRAHGFRPVKRQQYRSHAYQRQIDTVSIITPAGVFSRCKPSEGLTSLTDGAKGWLELGGFFLFEKVNLRTLNHTAAELEQRLLSQIAALPGAEMLVPHLIGMSKRQLGGALWPESISPGCARMANVIREGRRSCPW